VTTDECRERIVTAPREEDAAAAARRRTCCKSNGMVFANMDRPLVKKAFDISSSLSAASAA
jgi:hypothetical protein